MGASSSTPDSAAGVFEAGADGGLAAGFAALVDFATDLALGGGATAAGDDGAPLSADGAAMSVPMNGVKTRMARARR
jgi:hypothetical protein